MPITTAEKAACAKREAAMRRAVYGRKHGRPLPPRWQREVDVMDAIAADYGRQLERERSGADLFDASGASATAADEEQ